MWPLISIHAPAKGATRGVVDHSISLFISIHAPAKGATRTIRSQSLLTQYFNPRPREGSDKRKIINLLSLFISIHAPAKGATYPNSMCHSMLMIFQSTPPRRERQVSQEIFFDSVLFQSTPPRRERLQNRNYPNS